MTSSSTARQAFFDKRARLVELLNQIPIPAQADDRPRRRALRRTETPASASYLAGCGYMILASDTALLAHRLETLAAEIESGDYASASGSTMLMPESIMGDCLKELLRLGLRVESDRDKPKEPFDVYRFRLLDPPTSGDPASLATGLRSLSDSLYAQASDFLDQASVSLDQ